MQRMVRARASALFGRALVGTALVGTALLAVAPASAQEGVAMKQLLGEIGVIAKEKDPIRYRERAPLVLPPRMELREPGAMGSVAAKDPQWPTDPDVAARRSRAAAASRPVTDSEVRRMAERNPALSVDEIRAGRNPNAVSGVVPGTHRGDNARDVLLLNPDQVGGRKAEEADAGPVARRTLADPPSAFRQTARGGAVASDYTPRVDQQTIDASPMAWLTRKFKRDDDD